MSRPLASAWGQARAIIVLLVVTAAAILPATASASRHTHTTRPQARIALIGPHSHYVKGAIPFVAHFVGKPVREVVFSVDGHRDWTARRRPFRYRHSGRLNTRNLHNGVHILAVKAFLAHRRVVIARLPIDVRNLGNGAPSTVTAFGPPIAGVSGPSVAAFNRESYSYSSTLSTPQEANRYQVLVLQATDGAQVSALKAANPNLKIFMYQHPWYSRATDPAGMSVCTSYPSDLANHPDWFLHDANGNPVPASSPQSYLMDIGNPAYQQACIQHAATLAKKWGFDGVFWDGIDSVLNWELPVGVAVPEYSSASTWQAAMFSFLTNASSQLHATGLQDIGNLCRLDLTPGLWAKWSAPLDGSEEEGWTDAGGGLAQQDPVWAEKLANVAWSEANGKYVLLHSYSTTETGNTFGLASMLLVANGHASYSTSNANYTSAEATYPEFTTAQQLGAPAGGARQLSNGVYERAFSNGIVLVNPSSHSVPPFSLGGGVYSGSQLSSVTQTGLGANRSLILLKVS